MTPITYAPNMTTKSAFRGGPGAYWRTVTRSKQLPPYVPARYYRESAWTLVNGTYTSDVLPTYWTNYVYPGYCSNYFKNDSFASDALVISMGFFTAVGKPSIGVNMGTYRVSALNAASAKFNAALRDKAEMWTTFHERKQALQSMEGLSKHLHGFTDVVWDVAKGIMRPRAAAKKLAASLYQSIRNAKVGVSNTANALRKTDLKTLEKRFLSEIKRWQMRLKSKSSDAADLWLELSFGWIPTVKDLGACINILTEDPPSSAVEVSIRRYCQGSMLNNRSGHYGSRSWEGSWRVKVGAVVKSVDNRLFTADSLGFTNPALVAWQLMPWSFIVDWFFNVSQYLESWTGVMGITLGDVYTTEYGKAKMSGGWYETDGKKVIRFAKANSEGFYINRTLSLPQVKFQKRDFNFGPLRALTTLALTVQQMRKF